MPTDEKKTSDYSKAFNALAYQATSSSQNKNNPKQLFLDILVDLLTNKKTAVLENNKLISTPDWDLQGKSLFSNTPKNIAALRKVLSDKTMTGDEQFDKAKKIINKIEINNNRPSTRLGPVNQLYQFLKIKLGEAENKLTEQQTNTPSIKNK